jgi:glycine/D-amino acid oxidase-like deaminating enzyme
VASKSVVVIGGGLIGLTSALALHERGASGALVDRAALGSRAARGNAGFLSPTLLSPLPGPGMLRTAAHALIARGGPEPIRSFGPNIVAVALGNPKQERGSPGTARPSARRYSSASAAPSRRRCNEP